jgi:hypothetical protein
VLPRIKRYKLLAGVALGGATLAIATGQLPALAYGPPPPPPPPGGYDSVVTSQTCDPAGCTITARIDGLLDAVVVPAGAFSTPVQITLLAPNVLGLGDAGHSGYRSVGGIGILIQVNGKTFTGTFAKPITVEVSGREIRPGDRVAVWNGTSFSFIGGTETAGTEEFSYDSGAEQDFALLAPLRGGGGGLRPGQRGGPARITGFSRTGYLGDVVLESVFFTPVNAPLVGVGVHSAEWLAARGP